MRSYRKVLLLTDRLSDFNINQVYDCLVVYKGYVSEMFFLENSYIANQIYREEFIYLEQHRNNRIDSILN